MILAALWPDGMTELTLWILLGSSFVASFITAAFGIGGGVLLLTVMASLMPPVVLIPTHGVIQLGSNLGRAMIMARHVLWRALIPFGFGSLIGEGLGGVVVINIPPALIQIGIGLFVIWSVMARTPQMVRDQPFGVGIVSSFLTMFFGASGLFVAIFTRAQGIPRRVYIATHAALMSVQHGLKTVVFILLGFSFGEWLGLIAAMTATGLAGTIAGGRLLRRIDERIFSKILNLLLILLSLRLIHAGLQQLQSA